MNEAILKILNMHCASCATNIENVLKKEGGIKSANVNFASEKLYLKFDPSQINIANIKKRIEKLGYEATEEFIDGDMRDRHERARSPEIQKLKKRFFFASIFSFPIIYIVLSEMFNLPRAAIVEAYGSIIQFVLVTIVIVFSFNIWASGFKKLLHLTPNMDTLIFIGTATAYFYSLIIAILIFLK